MAEKGNVIMDGRDIGTYVLPNANIKIYQVAELKERAKRRYIENLEKGINCTLEEVIKDLEKRDYIDSHRAFAPLKPADDAILLDTTKYNKEEVVEEISKIIKENTPLKEYEK